MEDTQPKTQTIDRAIIRVFPYVSSISNQSVDSHKLVVGVRQIASGVYLDNSLPRVARICCDIIGGHGLTALQKSRAAHASLPDSAPQAFRRWDTVFPEDCMTSLEINVVLTEVDCVVSQQAFLQYPRSRIEMCSVDVVRLEYSQGNDASAMEASADIIFGPSLFFRVL